MTMRDEEPIRPPWWTQEDEQVLRGEMQKLADLPRPLYMERLMHRHEYVPIRPPGRRRRWTIRDWAAVILFVVALATIVATSLLPGGRPATCPGNPACAGFATPTTFPPPPAGAR